MEWWNRMVFPLRRVWFGLSRRLGTRRNGLLKLRHDVRACEYEDVQIMWQILESNYTELGHFSAQPNGRPSWKIFGWAKRAPNRRRNI